MSKWWPSISESNQERQWTQGAFRQANAGEYSSVKALGENLRDETIFVETNVFGFTWLSNTSKVSWNEIFRRANGTAGEAGLDLLQKYMPQGYDTDDEVEEIVLHTEARRRIRDMVEESVNYGASLEADEWNSN